MQPKQRILILDFGSQYTQLIARRVRECGVYSVIVDASLPPKEIMAFSPSGIILSGGPESVTLKDTPRAPECVFTLGVPVLGICYGMQTMALQLGGRVEKGDKSEFGYAKVAVENSKGLFHRIEDSVEDAKACLDVWMSHGDRVAELPPGFTLTASTHTAPIAAMADFTRQFFGIQFHPEVTHTRQGQRILDAFLKCVCGCNASWTPDNIIDSAVARIREQVGPSGKVVVGLSGGVDSSVVAALVHRAIGDRLTCVFVDTGLLRMNEGDQVMDVFAAHLGVNVQRINAEKRFLEALAGVTDPEQKRKIVGEQFIRVFEQAASELKDVKWLGQGTIYPDVIESAKVKSGKAHVIKSHHNVGGLPDDMQFELIEPLRDLFKDEVRQVGLELGLPRELVFRHPFPGPGLCLRILGEVTEQFVELLQRVDAIFIELLREHHLYDKVGQAFAVFLPVKSVGVKGDARCYEYVIALRAVETIDFMTARWAQLPYEFLSLVSERILNDVAEVSRVVYDISGKPPATIEWE